MAILAGDALFLDPYALIAQADLPSQIKVDLIANLSLLQVVWEWLQGKFWIWKANTSICL